MGDINLQRNEVCKYFNTMDTNNFKKSRNDLYSMMWTNYIPYRTTIKCLYRCGLYRDIINIIIKMFEDERLSRFNYFCRHQIKFNKVLSQLLQNTEDIKFHLSIFGTCIHCIKRGEDKNYGSRCFTNISKTMFGYKPGQWNISSGCSNLVPFEIIYGRFRRNN